MDRKGQPINKEEYVGRFKQKSIEVCKSVMVNEIIQDRENNLKINQIIRGSIIEQKKSHPFIKDKDFAKSFLKLYEKIGGFKEWLFIDGVDIAYCYDGNRLGYHIDRINNVCIDHSLGDIKIHKILWKTFLCTNHNYIRKYYMQRNYRYLREMYKDDGYDFSNMPVAFKGIIFRIIFFEDDKLRKLKNVIRGKRDYIKGIKGKYPYHD